MLIRCGNIEETATLAAKLANNLKGGEVIELSSDLGGGKTTFTRFLVKTLRSQDVVSSPSFTIENIYRCKNFDVHHFDFYRLEEAGIMGEELDEVLRDSESVAIVEWAGIVNSVLPEKRLRIVIEAPSENERIFELQYPQSLSYLIGGIA